jgi:hypothetical protein
LSGSPGFVVVASASAFSAASGFVAADVGGVVAVVVSVAAAVVFFAVAVAVVVDVDVDVVVLVLVAVGSCQFCGCFDAMGTVPFPRHVINDTTTSAEQCLRHPDHLDTCPNSSRIDVDNEQRSSARHVRTPTP